MRTTFLLSNRWVIVPALDVRKDEEPKRVAPGTAAEVVWEAFRDDSALPELVALHQQVTGTRLRAATAHDLEAHVRPSLADALRRGTLVMLDLPAYPPSKVGTRAPPPPPVPSPTGPKKPPKRIKEKSFLDLQVLNTKGKPLVGRRFELELPDGKKEKGVLAGDARIQKGDLDPGTATLRLLPAEGDVFEGKDAEPAEPEGDTLSMVLQGGDGKALANAHYRLTVNGAVHEGIADGSGKLEEKGLPPATEALLEWGPEPDGAVKGSPYVYAQTLFLDVEGSDDEAVERQLANLGYVDGTLDERRAAFAKDYDGSISDVMANGTAAKSGSATA